MFSFTEKNNNRYDRKEIFGITIFSIISLFIKYSSYSTNSVFLINLTLLLKLVLLLLLFQFFIVYELTLILILYPFLTNLETSSTHPTCDFLNACLNCGHAICVLCKVEIKCLLYLSVAFTASSVQTRVRCLPSIPTWCPSPDLRKGEGEMNFVLLFFYLYNSLVIIWLFDSAQHPVYEMQPFKYKPQEFLIW